MPLEVSPIALDIRPRLRHSIGLRELLNFVRLHGFDERYQPKIEEYSMVIMNQGNELFLGDMYSFISFQLGFQDGKYKVTLKGKEIVGKRLNISYGDGFEFKAATKDLQRMNAIQSRALKEKILTAGDRAADVMNISQNIGKEIGVDVRLAPPYF